jgi:hypothetical protein
MKMKKYRKHAVIAGVILAVLALAFWWGGDAPGLEGWNGQSEPAYTADTTLSSAPATEVPLSSSSQPPASPATAPTESASPQETEEPATAENRPGGNDEKPLSGDEKVSLAAEMAEGSSSSAPAGSEEYSKEQGMELDQSTGKDRYQTAPVPEGKPVPVEPQNAVITDQAYTCTLSVRCDTILNHMAWLDPEKAELVPEDGVIFPSTEVTFYEGESVFNLLVREMKKNKIHLEFVNTPLYGSAYIEGIHNLYEFDCGELSGWVYKVNGWAPNYGCSRYGLKPGDVVEWVYTCDLGRDVGGYNIVAGE